MENARGLATTILLRQVSKQMLARKRARVVNMDSGLVATVECLVEPTLSGPPIVGSLSRLGRRQRALVEGVQQGRNFTEICARLGDRISVAELTRVAADLRRRLKSSGNPNEVTTAEHMGWAGQAVLPGAGWRLRIRRRVHEREVSS